jgi:hypothetical protein
MRYVTAMHQEPAKNSTLTCLCRRVQAEGVPAMGEPHQAPQAADLLNGQRYFPGRERESAEGPRDTTRGHGLECVREEHR